MEDFGKFATVKQATARYKICRNTLMKYADQFHALARFGHSVRIDVEKFDAGIAGKGIDVTTWRKNS